MSGMVYDQLLYLVREVRVSSTASLRHVGKYIYMARCVLIQDASRGVACELSIAELAEYLNKRNGVSGRLYTYWLCIEGTKMSKVK